MSWTDERVALLKKMWEEGMSASQIATQFGDVSRNAVIGKVHRSKILRLDKSASEKTLKEDALAIEVENQDLPIQEADVAIMVDKIHHLSTERVRKKSFSSPAARTESVTEKNIRKDPVADIAPPKQGRVKTAKLAQPEISVDETITNEQDADDGALTRGEYKNGGADDDVVVPIARRLSLLQLTENTCKWPIGDPLGAGFYFCGAKTCEGSPYCSYHSKIAFQPIAERRRIKA